MRRAFVVTFAVGLIVAVLGLIWALQGFGVLGGSPMSNTTTWSISGPITVVIGIVITLVETPEVADVPKLAGLPIGLMTAFAFLVGAACPMAAGILGMFLVVPFLGVVAATWRTVLRVLDTGPVEATDDDGEDPAEVTDEVGRPGAPAMAIMPFKWRARA